MSEGKNRPQERETPGQSPVTRREFLTRLGSTLGVAGLACVGWYALYDPTGKAGLPRPRPLSLPNYFESVYDSFGPSDPRMVVVRGNERTSVTEMVRRALEPLGGIGRFVKRGDVVLLKPNVAFDRPAALGATTDPRVVQAVAELCLKEAGAAAVLVADNPIETAENCFYKTGIAQAARRAGARIVLPSAGKFRQVQVRPSKANPARHEAIDMWPVFYEPLRRANKVIGLPVIKDHNLSGGSMAMKNWYGLLGGRRNQFHQAIHDIISDLGLLLSPTLVIADATRVLMRNGPTGGRLEDVRKTNTIVASVDQIACDAWCYENLLQRDPARLTYLEYAYEKFGGGRKPKRFGERDWRAYKNRGLLVEITL